MNQTTSQEHSQQVADIVDFPEPDQSDWGIYSKGMRKTMIDSGFEPQDADEFLQHFEPVFRLFDFKLDATMAVDMPEEYLPQFEKYSTLITSSLERYTSELIAERFGLEMERFFSAQLVQ